MHRHINGVHIITTPMLKLHRHAAEHEARHAFQDGQVGIAVIIGIAGTLRKIPAIQQVVDIQRQFHIFHIIGVDRYRVLYTQVQQEVGRYGLAGRGARKLLIDILAGDVFPIDMRMQMMVSPVQAHIEHIFRNIRQGLPPPAA